VKVFLSDGRALRYWSSATPGPVVLFFHGCPDSRRMAMTGAKAAYDAGVRLVAFNRPGYGSSTAAASSHTSVARDAVELLDLWGIDRVAALGMSVGGSYAAAFAATYPERTTALGLVSAQGNEVKDVGGTVEEAMEGMRPEFMAWRAEVDPDDEDEAALAVRFLAELPEPDGTLLRAFDDQFLGGLAWEALVKPDGYLRDAALLFREWDYDTSVVRCPTTVWCGELDDKAVAGSSWWSDRIPQAEVEVLPRTTHLAALLTQWRAVLRRLASGHETATG
jgi:pimeloyl-ACP methyl ester carboxylesterase